MTGRMAKHSILWGVLSLLTIRTPVVAADTWTWSSTLVSDHVTTPQEGPSPYDFDVDANGTTYIVYTEVVNGRPTLFCAIRSPGGDLTREIVCDVSPANRLVYATIAVDGSGMPHIIYTEEYVTYHAYSQSITTYLNYRERVASGNWWGGELEQGWYFRDLEGYGTDQGGDTVGSDPSLRFQGDHGFLVYRNYMTPGYEGAGAHIQLREREPGSWSEPSSVYSDELLGAAVVAGEDTSGDLHIIINDRDMNNGSYPTTPALLHCRRSGGIGGPWQTQTIVEAHFYLWNPLIPFDADLSADGTVHVAYWHPETKLPTYQTCSGGSWSAPQSLAITATLSEGDPVGLRVAQDGVAKMCFGDLQGGGLYFSLLSGTWKWEKIGDGSGKLRLLPGGSPMVLARSSDDQRLELFYPVRLLAQRYQPAYLRDVRARAGLFTWPTSSPDSMYVYGGPYSLNGRFEDANGYPDEQGWTKVDYTGAGQFAQVWGQLQEYDPFDLHPANTTPRFAFIDDGYVVPETGGSYCWNWCYGPNGCVVNTTGGVLGGEAYLHNEIRSPAIAIPAGYRDEILLNFEAYIHSPGLGPVVTVPTVAAYWSVRFTEGTAADLENEPWQSDQMLYYGGPATVKVSEPLSDLMLPGDPTPEPTYMQVALGVKEVGETWDIQNIDVTPAPYFDNVSVMAIRTPEQSGRIDPVYLAQDAFPAIGVLQWTQLYADVVPFDAACIPPSLIKAMAPEDSIRIRCAERPEMVYRVFQNPLFDPYREGLSGIQTVALDSTAQDRPGWWSLNDDNIATLYPGDRIRYFFRIPADYGGWTLVPKDTTGFSDPATTGATWSGCEMRALPTMHSTTPGDQPPILLWDDGGEVGAGDEWREVLSGLGLVEGTDYDVYTTRAASSGLGNGLGGRATADQLSGYATIYYTSARLSEFTLSDGSPGPDPSNDVALLDAWLRQGDKNLVLFGRRVVADLINGSAEGQRFLTDWLPVASVYVPETPWPVPRPVVSANAANPVFTTTTSWTADITGDPFIPWIQPAAGTQVLATLNYGSGEKTTNPLVLLHDDPRFAVRVAASTLDFDDYLAGDASTLQSLQDMLGDLNGYLDDIGNLYPDIDAGYGDFGVADSLLLSGGLIDIDPWGPENLSQVAVADSFDVGYYLSPDSTITAADHLVGELVRVPPMAPGTHYSWTDHERTAPTDLPSGEYWFGALLDVHQETADYGWLNNQVSVPVTLLGIEWADVTAAPADDPGDSRGAAWVDVDDDGDLDLYVIRANQANLLLRNNGGWSFTDVAAGPEANAGNTTGMAWGDYDNDGLPDLYLGNGGEANLLLHNEGGGSFSDVTGGALGETGDTRGVAWVDYDRDGLLDLYLCNAQQSNRLLRNLGEGDFVDVTAGPEGDAGDTRGCAWGDYDNDGDQDVYLCNDGQANRLLRNDAGVFVDVTAAPLDIVGDSPDAAWGDYDDDGDLDLFVSVRLGADHLLRNEGDGSFVDVTAPPLGDTGDTRSVTWADRDNDGRLDLYLSRANQPNLLYVNLGEPGFFELTTAPIGDDGPGESAAWGDGDGDGTVDLYVANLGADNLLVENRSGGGMHWLHVDLTGTFSNHTAIGARVRVVTGNRVQIREVEGGGRSQPSFALEFGLGADTLADSVDVTWPRLLSTGIPNRVVLTDVTADQVVAIVEEVVSGDAVDDGVLPSRFAVQPCIPNPFNPRATIRYDLPRNARVSLRIYDLAGRLVRTLVNGEEIAAGSREAVWDGRSDAGRPVAAGAYFCRMEAGSFRGTIRMTLVK